MREALFRVLDEYQANAYSELKDNNLAGYIRNGVPSVIKDTAHISSKYLIKGSPGQGVWAEVPWVCIFDKSITTSAERGYYIVYLFNASMDGVYLSLNQGWTQYEKKYHPLKKAQEEIRSMALHYRGLIRSALEDFPVDVINLHAQNTLGKGYEFGHICGKYYAKDDIPGTDELADDLRNLIGVYRELKGYLSGKPVTEKKVSTEMPEEQQVIDEEEKQEREASKKSTEEIKNKAQQAQVKPPVEVTSKHYPRDPYVAAYVKRRAGGKCELCDKEAPFISSNHEPFLECHHIIERAANGPDTINNAVALCPNCHRKLHNLGLEEDKLKLKEKRPLNSA